MIRHGAEHLEPHVGEGADGERQPGVGQVAHQLGILGAAHPVIDAAHRQLPNRLPDIVGRSLLPRVGHHRQPQLPRPGKDPGKLGRRIAKLPRIEADPVQPRQIRLGLAQGGEGILFAQVAQKAHDEPPADAKLPLPLLQCPLEAAEHGAKGHAPGTVGLGVEEDLHVHHLVGGAAFKVGPGEVEEVLLGDQHAGPQVVEIEKGLQAVELIGSPQALHVGPGQGHPVASAQGKHQLGLEGALDMQVQLQLGQAGNKVLHDDGSIVSA
ncbi:hypothetical protein D3C78_512360 [compost metagenome]